MIITALRNESGAVIGFAKVIRDLTERRRAEEKREAERREAERVLRESEQMFRLLVDQVRNYAIVYLDPEGRVMTWNAGAERIKGLSRRRDHRPVICPFLSTAGCGRWRAERIDAAGHRSGRCHGRGIALAQRRLVFLGVCGPYSAARQIGASAGFCQGHTRHHRAETRRAVHGDSRRIIAPSGRVARLRADSVHHLSHGGPRLCRRRGDTSPESAG